MAGSSVGVEMNSVTETVPHRLDGASVSVSAAGAHWSSATAGSEPIAGGVIVPAKKASPAGSIGVSDTTAISLAESGTVVGTSAGLSSSQNGSSSLSTSSAAFVLSSTYIFTS